jgi:copper transport protein
MALRSASVSSGGILIVLMWAGSAWAHAAATGTDPVSGAVLESAPEAVTVEFNQPVTPVDAATGVVAPDGTRSDTAVTPSEDGSSMSIAFDGGQEGTYLVGYRVVSDDGHPVSGTFTFSIGTETEAPDAAALAVVTDPTVQASLYAVRWVGYTSLALALGAGVLLAFGARPRQFVAKLVAWGLTAIATTAVLGIVLQAAYESGAPISGVEPAALQTVMESNFGLAALLRLLLVLLAVPLLRIVVTGDEEPRKPLVAGLAAVGLALAATWPLSGHPMAIDPVVVAFIADWVHLTAALAWAGGVLVLLVLTVRKGTEVPGSAAEAWIALVPWLVANLLVAGVASALLNIDSIAALTDTTYGRLVMLKAAILVVVAGVGLFTRRALLRGADGKPRLRVLTGVEVTFLAVVLGVVAVLVQTVPAKTALQSDAAQSESTETATLVTTDAYSAQLVLDPGRPGPNSVRILADDLAGAPFAAVEWEAEFGPEGGDTEAVPLIELRTGILAGEVNLPDEGRWVFTFTLTDAEGTTATAEAVVDVD